MAQDHKDAIITHLEFLGFELEDLKADKGHLFIAKNVNRSNLLVRMLDNMVILTARYGGFDGKALKSRDFYQAINSVNQTAISKWYYDIDDEGNITIVIEADYYDYSKTTFATFLENFEKEVQGHIVAFEKFYTDAS